MNELLVVVEGSVIGRLTADRFSRMKFEYERAWLDNERSHSLSVTLPLGQTELSQRMVLPWLWNLLPENRQVLQRWAQQYQVSAAHPFKLLMHVGDDLPGAAQFIPGEKLQQAQSNQPTIEWLTDEDLSQRLIELREDIAAARRPGDIGRTSLPGATAKTALYWDEQTKRWGVPGGSTPTTHIIKPAPAEFHGLVENQHLCHELAARLGLPVARSRVLQLEQSYLVLERFDRLPPTSGSPLVRRVHQEDLCQALGQMPTSKYQEQGGPGIPTIVSLLRRVSCAPEIDVDRFLQANMLNWLLGGTNAHAKHYSLLIGAGDEIRLAPLYDISSQLPYSHAVPQRLSMKIGEHHEIARVNLADWRDLARACAISEDRMLGLLSRIARELPEHISAARDQAIADGLHEPIVTQLAKQLAAHVNARSATSSSRPAADRSPAPG